ncbi:MAG TPA: hypothetical protein VI072_03880 [Polyangiaceae bacterium]
MTLEDACKPRRILAVRSVPDAAQATPECSLTEGGGVALRFRAPACDPNNSWFAGCRFLEQHDLRQFDADFAGEGALAAEICVENLAFHDVNLWYGGRFAPSDAMITNVDRQKYMRLLRWSEAQRGVLPDAAVRSTCRIVFLSPGDACTLTNTCGNTCRQSDGREACLDYGLASLTLMAEWCARASDSQAEADTLIHLKSLWYYPKACSCNSDSACSGQRVCHREGWREDAACAANAGKCRGLCML